MAEGCCRANSSPVNGPSEDSKITPRASTPPGDARVVLTGGAGCIGKRLIAHFESRGTPFKSLVRGKDWEVPIDASDAGRADPALFSGARAVVHLAGEPLTTGRWTEEKMARIRISRVEGTRLVARSCARAEVRPRVLIVASGAGYYGSRGDEELTEQSGVGSGFLAEVARDWEAAAETAIEVGIRVVFLRMGAVLAKDGGLLRESWPWARAGLLAKVSGPKRWVSWIGMQDLIEVVDWAIERDALSGAVNAVAPSPTTLNEMVVAIARAADRPVAVSMPPWAVRALMGAKAEAILESCRVVPEKLRRMGFRFSHPQVEEAIRAECR